AIPTLTTTTSTTTTAAASKPEKPDAVSRTRTRPALGELANAGKNAKGKTAAKEEKKVVPPPMSRRTTRETREEKPVEEKVAKRKAAASTSSSTTTTSSKVPLTKRIGTTKPLRKPLVERELAAEPAPKRRRTSTPPVVEEAEDDVTDAGHYDEDGQEILLSSGGRRIRAQSPVRLARADDGWTDLDAEDEGDPSMVSEYVVDAFKYLMEIEDATMPNAYYMEKQTELQWKMRAILMDWIIEVHSKFRLLPETLFITTNLIDRFLTKRVISLIKFQLVGLTALFIAAKYEEVICPSINNFLDMTDGGYGVEEVLKAERYMLSTLKFDLSYPNPLHFLRRISKADDYEVQTRTLAKYLIEISCVDNELMPYPPSRLAAAATWLSRYCLERGDWSPNLVHYSTYTEEECILPAQIMLDYVLGRDFSDTTSFYRKYASKKFMKASVFFREWAVTRWPDSVGGDGEDSGRELLVEFGVEC
ncbi:G2/mitotic-specific cyclin 2, partial [Tremellales sp. Uapishka_1]